MLKLGIVGCGTIGGIVARAVSSGPAAGIRLAALCDEKPERAKFLAARLPRHPRVLNLPDLCAACDLVLEAAGMAAVGPVARQALAARKELMVMSVGGLLLEPVWPDRFARAGIGLYYPSGAVAGLDALRSAAVGGLQKVTLTTRKPAGSLPGGQGLRRATVLFEGSALAAVRRFPQNINVAAAVALAGVGPARTRVRIIADPRQRLNSHTLEAQGAFGKLTATTENRPSPDNPKTSYLAALSAVAMLRQLARSRGCASSTQHPRKQK